LISTGISAKIRNAYSFLAHNYNFRRESDETILVGFSRGASAVQCLASLISQTGLLEKQYLYYLRGLLTLWAHQQIKGGSNKLAEKVQRLKDAEVLRSMTIAACTVWDSVSSLGLPIELPSRALSFVGKQVPNRVDHAFQALSLDEKRSKFKPYLWEYIEPGERRIISVSQCWFLGAHADVGGNGDAALGAMTLLWMIGKLHDRVGVLFNESEIAKHLKHKYLE
jgi:uncharacterized protein (DUF2235 family)